MFAKVAPITSGAVFLLPPKLSTARRAVTKIQSLGPSNKIVPFDEALLNSLNPVIQESANAVIPSVSESMYTPMSLSPSSKKEAEDGDHGEVRLRLPTLSGVEGSDELESEEGAKTQKHSNVAAQRSGSPL
mmetsp:Transcript_38025/g.49933  ORF Transcript_38025/g.49933 Transcript_38025/m.49933 type:complete len:131 (-) Transcript_38025:548-940(-)